MLRTVTIERLSRVRQWLPRDVYFWAKTLILAAIAIELAQLAWTIATPLGPVGDWRPAQARAMAPGAQAALIAVFDPFNRGASRDEAVGDVTDLDITLFGVRENRGAGTGSAIIAGPDGIQKSIGVGEEIMAGVRLSGVAFDFIVIERGGRKEKLFLDQSTPAEVVADGTTSAPLGGDAPASAAGAISAAAARQGIALAPRSEGGRVTGIVLSPQGDGKIFAAAGFRPGDIVTAINGRRVTSAADLAALSGQIAPGARLSITVERGAETVPVALNLSGNP
ncbi:MAG: PDZ domain-containing protein [Sphingomonadales bacterium]|nr:PDZ domain-containing protein [Sphingomonadales bacterium]